MNTVAHAEAAPAYRVDTDGSIQLNDAGQLLRTRYEALKTQVEVLDRSWCDAVLVSLRTAPMAAIADHGRWGELEVRRFGWLLPERLLPGRYSVLRGLDRRA